MFLKTFLKGHQQMKKYNRAVQVLLLLGVCGVAFAGTAGTTGGLSTANQTAENVKVGLFALLGTCAALYMIYLAFMAFTEKKSWSDFGWGIVHVAGAGGAVAVATWAWGLFSGA